MLYFRRRLYMVLIPFFAYFKFGDGWYKIEDQPAILKKRRLVRLPEST